MSALFPTPLEIRMLQRLRSGAGYMEGAITGPKRAGRKATVRQLWRNGLVRPKQGASGQYELTKIGFQLLREIEQAHQLAEQAEGMA